MNRPSTFSDMATLDEQSLKKIIYKVDRKLLTLALKGMDKESRTKFLGVLPSRTADMLQWNMECMGPVRIKEVEEAQRRILDLLNRMVNNGEITVDRKILELQYFRNTMNNEGQNRDHDEFTLEELAKIYLFQEEPQVKEEIPEVSYSFNVIIELDDRTIQEILRKVSKKDLAMALMDADEKIQEVVFRNVSSRAADIIRHEMDYLGTVDINEILETQQKIGEWIHKMAETLEIILLRRE